MEEQDYILFEEYLSGNLTDTDKNTFEKRLKEDKSFNQAFLTYQEILGFFEKRFKNEEDTSLFEENLRSISNKHFNKKEEKTRVVKFKPWKYAVAASIAILLGVFIFNTGDPSYNDFSDHNSISLTVRGENDAIQSKAEKAFNEKDFKNAELYFNEILIADKNNTEIELYKSITLIELNRFDESDRPLEHIANGTSAFKNKALWYLALSKLKQKDYKACESILIKIPKEADEYNSAKKLLRKL